MLLKFYLGTCIFCLIGYITCLIELIGYAKRNNLTMEKPSKMENIAGFIKLLVTSVLPLINIVFGLMFFFSKTVREKIITEMYPRI